MFYSTSLHVRIQSKNLDISEKERKHTIAKASLWDSTQGNTESLLSHKLTGSIQVCTGSPKYQIQLVSKQNRGDMAT